MVQGPAGGPLLTPKSLTLSPLHADLAYVCVSGDFQVSPTKANLA
jgi:hypothetical protein